MVHNTPGIDYQCGCAGIRSKTVANHGMYGAYPTIPDAPAYAHDTNMAELIENRQPLIHERGPADHPNIALRRMHEPRTRDATGTADGNGDAGEIGEPFTPTCTFRCDHDADTGTITIKLAGADLEHIKAAIDNIANDIPDNPETGKADPLATRRAEASRLLILGGPDGKTPQQHSILNIFADADLLATLFDNDRDQQTDAATATRCAHTHGPHPDTMTNPGAPPGQAPPPFWPRPRHATTTGGHDITSDLLETLLCGARSRVIGTNPDGTPADVIATNAIPTRIREYVRARDQHCRFPGCTHTTFADIHHIREQQHGGTHSPHNLLVACDYHHRFIHRAEWSIHGDPETPNLTFKRPDGTVFAPR